MPDNLLGERRLIALDAFAALLYTFVVAGIESRDGGSALDALLAVATGAALAARRKWPPQMLAVVVVLAIPLLVRSVSFAPFLSAAFALYPVALKTPRLRWSPTPVIAALSGLVLFGGTFAGPKGWQSGPVGTTVVGLAIVGASWALARLVRERRAATVRTARQLADQAVSEERLRIARELHDVVAHNMSLIAIKSGVAVHVAEARPQEGLDALRVIESVSRGALTEMRQLLGVLRQEPDLVPAPDLGGLAALASRAALAGVRVELELDTPPLPEGVALSAYRIVQEALTNVVKHAAPARCRVAVVGDGSELRIAVTDDGPGVRTLPSDHAGHGLIGMRERVMMYGGHFTAGPRPEGGFAVSAHLPFEPMGSAT